jgi:hypothetical protein
MKEKLKKIKIRIMRIPALTRLSNSITLYMWEKNKSRNPPSIIKQKKVIALSKKYNIRHLIETGTYLGDMVFATKDVFTAIDSIELSCGLYEDAVRRFRKENHIKIWNGDSALILVEIIKDSNEPVLFWLDAHYSGGKTARSILGDTPIEKELDIIFNTWNDKSLILIDDARCFTGKDGYPTIDALRKLIGNKSEDLKLNVEDDIIAIQNKNIDQENNTPK